MHLLSAPEKPLASNVSIFLHKSCASAISDRNALSW
jgi:hypothetical protein